MNVGFVVVIFEKLGMNCLLKKFLKIWKLKKTECGVIVILGNRITMVPQLLTFSLIKFNKE
jgi:hypothetical protein